MEKMPKYSKLEIERKWLIKTKDVPSLSALKKFEITDKYFPETRLRLRKMYNPQSGENIYKFCKKYGKQSSISEPIANVYLEESEYLLLNNLPGRILTKNRYKYIFNEKQFSIDEFISSKGNFYLLELEVDEEGGFENVELPDFIERDVTDETNFSGYSLALAASQG